MPSPRLRFPKAARVKSKNDFARAYGRGNRARGTWLTVCVVLNGLDHTRLGLSVGKRVWKSAVRRNRVRRVFREAFRTSLPELPPGLDVILIGSVPRIEPSMLEVQGELVGLVEKAHRRHLERLAAEAAAEQAAPDAP